MPPRSGRRRRRNTRWSSPTRTPSAISRSWRPPISSWATATTSCTDPTKQGDATNDAYIQKAIENYRKAAGQNTDPAWKSPRSSISSAAYGSDKLNDPAKAEPVYLEIIALEPKEPGNYMALAKLYEDAGRYDDAEAQYGKAKAVKLPTTASVLAGDGRLLQPAGDFRRRSPRSKQAAALEPNNPEGYHRVAVFYWDKSRRRLPAVDRTSATTSRRARDGGQGPQPRTPTTWKR